MALKAACNPVDHGASADVYQGEDAVQGEEDDHRQWWHSECPPMAWPWPLHSTHSIANIYPPPHRLAEQSHADLLLSLSCHLLPSLSCQTSRCIIQRRGRILCIPNSIISHHHHIPISHFSIIFSKIHRNLHRKTDATNLPNTIHPSLILI